MTKTATTATQDRKTCQICGRAIMAKRGVIAKHGYKRPGEGWQTASCFGADELPFEVSEGALVKDIEWLEDLLAKKTAFVTADIAAVSVRLWRDAPGAIVRQGSGWENAYWLDATEANYNEVRPLMRFPQSRTWADEVAAERKKRDHVAKDVAAALAGQRERLASNPFKASYKA